MSRIYHREGFDYHKEPAAFASSRGKVAQLLQGIFVDEVRGVGGWLGGWVGGGWVVGGWWVGAARQGSSPPTLTPLTPPQPHPLVGAARQGQLPPQARARCRRVYVTHSVEAPLKQLQAQAVVHGPPASAAALLGTGYNLAKGEGGGGGGGEGQWWVCL